MAKLNWQISNDGFGPQFEVVANTRADAIAAAEARYLSERRDDYAYYTERYGDWDVVDSSPIPTFTAKRIR